MAWPATEHQQNERDEILNHLCNSTAIQ